MKIRAYLALMVVAILMPVVIFATISLNMLLESERAAALRGMRETVRATALMVDRELGNAEASLRALAGTDDLASGDLASFYEQAKKADKGNGSWTLLLDENGRQLINTLVPYGTPLPDTNINPHVQKVMASQKTVVADLLVGPMSGKLMTTVNYYAPTPGKKYVLSAVLTADYLQEQMHQPVLPEGWVVAVIDKQGLFITRSHNPKEMLGKPARAELVKAAATRNDGELRVPILEGVESQQVFTHSPLTGWTVALAAPVNVIEAPARRAVRIAALGLLAAVLLASCAAAFFSTRLVKSIRGAAREAAALGRGETPALSSSPVAEVEELHVALHQAGSILLQERRSRRQAEAEREKMILGAQEARQMAEAQNQAKDEFLAMLGHEIRNPLAAINGAVTILNLPDVSQEKMQRARSILMRQCSNLEHIVDDLLDVARVTSGKIILDMQPVDLSEVVRSCMDALQTAGRASHLAWQLQAVPAWIDADQTRLDQIISNLLGNALKYTGEGGRIEVAVYHDGAEAVLEVSDTGIGMPPELVPQVFDIFAQGAAALDRAQGGLGIGLTLVRKLVQMHGGSVQASSEGLGKGSRFTVRFPLVHSGRSSTIPPVAAAEAASRRILLIEDNQDARAMMSAILDVHGHLTLEADNGPEGVALALAESPDTAIVDIGLPGMDGYEVARALRADARTSHIALIALTGYGLETDRQNALEAGFDIHLVKPVDLPQLLDAIASRAASAEPGSVTTQP